MKKCAYCGEFRKLTNEHIFPDFFDKIFTKNWVTRQNNLKYIYQSEPKVKDVCAVCNNEILSKLDEYGKNITEKYLKNFIDRKVEFKYNYDLLLRWILKITYNASRAFGMTHIEYKEYLPYIMGKSNITNEIFMFVGVMKPSKDANEKIIYPNNISVGYLDLGGVSNNIQLNRMFYVKSYMFYLISWENKVDQNEFNKVQDLLKEKLGLQHIRPEKGRIELGINNSKIDYLTYRRQIAQPNKGVTLEQFNKIKTKLPEAELYIYK